MTGSKNKLPSYKASRNLWACRHEQVLQFLVKCGIWRDLWYLERKRLCTLGDGYPHFAMAQEKTQ